MDNKKIYTLADGIGFAELRWFAPETGDLEVVNCAKVSYASEAKEMGPKEVKLLNYLSANNHISPSYHSHISLRVKLPIFVAREYMRHTVGGSFSEISMRYVELGDKQPMEFYKPKLWRGQSLTNKQASNGLTDFQVNSNGIVDGLYSRSAEVYQQLIKNGTARELARLVLPVATYTEFVNTGSLEYFRHFLDLRMSKDAQREISAYAVAIYELLLNPFKHTLLPLMDRYTEIKALNKEYGL